MTGGALDALNPWAFLALLAVVPLVRWGRRSLVPFSPRRRGVVLAVRVLLLALLVAALADLRWRGGSDRRALYYLVDVSRSVGGEAAAAYRRFLEGRPAGGGSFQLEGTIAFAGRAARLEGEPGDPAIWDQLLPAEFEDRATDLPAALQFAQASFPSGHLKTVVLLTDGRSRGGWAREAAALRAAGVRVHAVVVDPPDRPEVLVREVRTPGRVKEEEPFNIEAEVVSTRAGPAVVKVFRNGALAHSEPIELQPGVNRYALSQSITEDKLTEFTVQVEAAGDTVVDNNALSALVHTSGRSKVLLLADVANQARYLRWALDQEGILLDVRAAVGAPTDLAALQNFDLLILDNVAATDLRREQIELFASYVRDFGGGFLMMGGDQSFGLGGYYRTPVEEILPVKCDFEKEKENPSLGLVLIIDKSGSMSGLKMEMAKEAAKAAVELLSPSDYAGVVVFDSQAFWAAELQPLIDKFGLVQLISTIRSGGGTNLPPAMELAYAQLGATPAKLKHVIILTDGQSTPGPFQELTGQMAQERITVSTVGVGSHIDQPLLENIARWGNGRFYYTDEAQSIPQIFAKETMTASKSALRDLPFQPLVVRPAPFLGDIDFAAAPFLYGYVVTEPKPTAEVWLSTEKGEPLLTTWRIGLGNVGAFASDARNRWAVEWLRWEGFGPFWAQVCRKLMRSASLDPFPVQVEAAAGGRARRVLVDAVEGGRFLTGLKGRAIVLGPGGKKQEVALDAGLPGRLAATFDTPVQGNYHLDIALLDAEGNTVNRQYTTATVGYPEEFLARPADTPTLAALANATGGLLNPTWDDVAAPEGRHATHDYTLWPWILAAALATFLLDVALKRWPVREGEGK